MSKVTKSIHRDSSGKTHNTVKTSHNNGVTSTVTREGRNSGFFGGKIKSTSRKEKK